MIDGHCLVADTPAYFVVYMCRMRLISRSDIPREVAIDCLEMNDGASRGSITLKIVMQPAMAALAQ